MTPLILAVTALAIIYLALYLLADLYETFNVESYPSWAAIVALLSFLFLMFRLFTYAHPTIIHP